VLLKSNDWKGGRVQKERQITVRGKQRSDIDAELFVQVLIAIGRDLDAPKTPPHSPDAFEAAIEDNGGSA
jgi:hypothetical protein